MSELVMWPILRNIFIQTIGTDEEIQSVNAIMNSNYDDSEKKRLFTSFFSTDEMQNKFDAYNYMFILDSFRDIKKRNEDKAFALLKKIVQEEVVLMNGKVDTEHLSKMLYVLSGGINVH